MQPRVSLSLEQQEQVRQAFDLFDETGSGVVDAAALKVVFRALAIEPTPDQLAAMIARVDKTNSHTVDFNEFLQILVDKMSERVTKEEANAAFRLFDLDRNNAITFANLRTVTDELGEKMNDEEVMELITAADLDQDGVVSEDEFRRVLTALR